MRIWDSLGPSKLCTGDHSTRASYKKITSSLHVFSPLLRSTRCFRMFSHRSDPPGPQWSAAQQALRVPRFILCCSLSQLIPLSLRLHRCRFMRTNWTNVGENLPNLLRIKRLRRSASCGQMRTMGDHRGPGRFWLVRGFSRPGGFAM